MTQQKSISILILIIGLTVTGCSINNRSNISAETDTPSQLNLPQTDSLTPIELPSPTLYLSIGEKNPDGCNNNRYQIWRFVPDAGDPIVLLANSDIDYLYPTLTSDETLFSYIASSPTVVKDLINLSDVEYGIDNLWLANPDGSNPKKISKDFPSLAVSMQGGCVYLFGLSSPAIWSSSNSLIAYIYRRWDDASNKIYYDYYVTDVKLDITSLVATNTTGSLPFWGNEDRLIISDSDGFSLFPVSDTGSTELRIEYPSEISGSVIPSYYQSSYNLLLAGFLISESVSSPKPSTMEIWTLDLSTLTWKKLSDFGINTWGSLYLGNSFSFVCDEDANRVIIFDPVTWQVNNVVEFPHQTKVDCYPVKIFSTGTVNVASFMITSGSNYELYSVNLLTTESQSQILFDSSKLSFSYPAQIPFFDMAVGK